MKASSMSAFENRLALFCAFLLAGALSGCATTMSDSDDPTIGVNEDGSPRWVDRSSGAYKGKFGKAFYGVGIAEHIRSEAMARRTADDRARHEIGRLFKVYLASMTQDYMRATTSDDGQAVGGSEEQDIVATQRTLTEVTLRGIQVRAHWRNPDTGALYALAVLEMGDMLGAMNRPKMNSPYVRHVRAHARAAFDQMDKELARPKEGAEQPAPPATAPEEESAPEDETADSEPEARAGSAKPRIGLRIQGTDAAKVQTCFAEKLIAAGYDVIEGSSDVDFIVIGSLKHRKADPVQGTVLIRSTLDLRVKELASGKTLVAQTKTLKIGRPTYNAAVMNATARFCRKVVPKMSEQIQTAISAG